MQIPPTVDSGYGEGGSTMGDTGGSRVDDSGLSGARDDIGTRDGGDRDGGGPGEGSRENQSGPR